MPVPSVKWPSDRQTALLLLKSIAFDPDDAFRRKSGIDSFPTISCNVGVGRTMGN